MHIWVDDSIQLAIFSSARMEILKAISNDQPQLGLL